MGTSSIEWTEHTWNPVVGCSKVSPGCKHCYAEVMSRRLRAMGVQGYEGKFTDVSLQHSRLEDPLNRKKPTMYFVNSMSDLFHPEVSTTFIKQVFEVMGRSSHHVFQVLTKRPERIQETIGELDIPKNVWLGTSVENIKHGLPRIDIIRTVRARVRFLSVEPLLEDLGEIDLKGIHWVIVGGESGHSARKMLPEWAMSVRDQCEKQRVPFFFKQWGAWGEDGIKRSKKKNGRLLDGRTWNQMPRGILRTT